MVRSLTLNLFAVLLFCLGAARAAGIAHRHRNHKRHNNTLENRGEILAPRFVGNVKRNSCRTRPSSQGAVSSVTQSATSSALSSAPAIISSFQPTEVPTVSFSQSDDTATSAVSVTPSQPVSSAVASTSFAPAPVATQSEATPSSSVPAPVTTQNEATPSSSTPPNGSQSSASSGTSASDISQYLSDQNTVRAQHGASPFSWNDTLANAAQEWANGCVFQHSGGTLGPYGENLAAGTGSSYGISAAISSWTDEVSQYDANNPVASHFTQVVWKASTQVGCAVQECSGIFPASYGEAQYYVCEYYPQGNVIGEFGQNVQV